MHISCKTGLYITKQSRYKYTWVGFHAETTTVEVPKKATSEDMITPNTGVVCQAQKVTKWLKNCYSMSKMVILTMKCWRLTLANANPRHPLPLQPG